MIHLTSIDIKKLNRVEERWLVTADGSETWFDCQINPSMRVHLIKLANGRLIEQTYTYLRRNAAGEKKAVVIKPRGAGWKFYGFLDDNSAIFRRPHDISKWKNLRSVADGGMRTLADLWFTVHVERRRIQDVQSDARSIEDRYFRLLQVFESDEIVCPACFTRHAIHKYGGSKIGTINDGREKSCPCRKLVKQFVAEFV